MQQKDGSTIRYTANDDFIAIMTAHDDPSTNIVRNIRGKNLEEVFEKLDTIYHRQTKGYSITIRNTDTPGLLDLITAKGYIYDMSYDYLALKLTPFSVGELKSKIYQSKYTYKIVKPEVSQSEEIYKLVDSCFPGFYDDYDDYQDGEAGVALALKDQDRKLLTLIAYHNDQPIGFSKLSYNTFFEDCHLGYLAGAGVIENYRHQSVYTNMIYHRAKAALDLGVHCISVEANSETSAPILTRYGFQMVEHVDVYMPPK